MRTREKQLEVENERLYHENEKLRGENKQLEKDSERRKMYDFEDRFQESLDKLDIRLEKLESNKNYTITSETQRQSAIDMCNAMGVKVCSCNKKSDELKGCNG